MSGQENKNNQNLKIIYNSIQHLISFYSIAKYDI